MALASPFVDVGSQAELEEMEDTLLAILKALGGGTGKPPPKIINYWSWIVVTVGNTAGVQLVKGGQLLFRLGIIQNINNSATPPTTPITISDSKNKVPAGILNPPTTKGQAGGSWPISSPAPGEYVDASGIFLTGQDAGDQVAFGYV